MCTGLRSSAVRPVSVLRLGRMGFAMLNATTSGGPWRSATCRYTSPSRRYTKPRSALHSRTACSRMVPEDQVEVEWDLADRPQHLSEGVSLGELVLEGRRS